MKIRTRHKDILKHTWKPYKFPDGFILVVDTREQKPLCTRVKGLVTIRDTLKDGDYSIKGFEDVFSIERKQFSDFYSYIGKERDRTVGKLERLSSMKFAALIIEENFSDLFLPSMYHKVSPEVARGFLTSVNIRYGIHTFFNRKRGVLERWLIDRAIKFYNLQREV